MEGNGGSVRDGYGMQGVYIMDGSVGQVGKCERWVWKARWEV
jgi:hypothetical protein